MKNVTIVFAILYSTILFSQTYTGKVVDKSNEPIAFANITAIQQSDSKIINRIISDENGNFSIDLKISFIGFITKKINPTKADLGIIIYRRKMDN